MDGYRFPGGQKLYLLFNSESVNYLLKTTGRETNASFVCLVLFKDRGRRVSPRFYLFVSDINQWNEEAGGVQD